jgi:hypothetical protein
MKIVVLGDIHGRLIWNDIIENPDKVILLRGNHKITNFNLVI